jgi:hypothetical protein
MKIDSGRRAGFVIPMVVPLLMGALIRLLFVRHGNLEERLYFLPTVTFPLEVADKHSLLFAGIKNAIVFTGFDPYAGLLALNTVVSVIMIIPFFMFVRARSGRVSAAYFSSLGLAIHPVIARFTCSDGHYSLLLFFWCCALVLLCDEKPGPFRVFAGIFLLTLAALMRIEGLIYIAATPLLLGMTACRAVVRRSLPFLLGALVMAAAIAFHYVTKLPTWGFEEGGLGGFVFHDSKNQFSLPWEFFSFLILSPMVVNLLWPLYFLLGLLPVFAALKDRELRWALGVFGAYILVALVKTPAPDSLDPGSIHRMIPGSMLRLMIYGAGATVVIDFFKSTWSRRMAWEMLLALCVMTPLANLDFMKERFSFNADFELLGEIRRDAGLSGSKCTLLMVLPETDLGVKNPERAVPGMKIADCTNPESCIREAAAGGCVYYFRNTWCYLGTYSMCPEYLEGRPKIINPCLILENSLELEKIREMEVDFKSSYPGVGSEKCRDKGVLGAYRVVSVGK